MNVMNDLTANFVMWIKQDKIYSCDMETLVNENPDCDDLEVGITKWAELHFGCDNLLTQIAFNLLDFRLIARHFFEQAI